MESFVRYFLTEVRVYCSALEWLVNMRLETDTPPCSLLNAQANHDPAAWGAVVAGQVRMYLNLFCHPHCAALTLLLHQIGFHAYPTNAFGPFTPTPATFAGEALHCHDSRAVDSIQAPRDMPPAQACLITSTRSWPK